MALASSAVTVYKKNCHFFFLCIQNREPKKACIISLSLSTSDASSTFHHNAIVEDQALQFFHSHKKVDA